jgi:RimJ/RimL family protein N-acetyltransferase
MPVSMQATVSDRADPLRREFARRAGGRFLWRSATPDDGSAVWDMWTGPDVRYWARDHRLAAVSTPPYDHESVRAYLRSYWERAYAERPVHPIVGLLDGQTPVAYAELYEKSASPYASHAILADVESEARGMHVIVADRHARLRGLAVEIAVDAADWQFEQWPLAEHCIADPDVRNVAAVSLCTRLGMKRVGVVDLGFRLACVMILERADWARRRSSIESMLEPLRRRRTADSRSHPGATEGNPWN